MKKIVSIFIIVVLIISTLSAIGNNTDNENSERCQECKKVYNNCFGMTDIPPRSEDILRLIDTDPQPTRSFDDLPNQFNWANYGGNWVTPVKDQAYPVYCGSCYIFAVWGAFEASIDIASGNPNTDIDLSEQYGLSCINSGCNGCGGGWGSTMIQNIVSTASGQQGNGVNGVPIESCMPYQADDSIPCSDKCSDWNLHSEPFPQPDDKLWQIADWGAFSISEDNPNDWDLLKTYLMDKGPIAVSMYWSNGLQNFVDTHHSPNDVYENDDSGGTNHLILLVGWVDDIEIMGGGYWILKNSHGTQQGYGGFCNLAYGCLNLGVGECDWVISEEWPEQEGPGPMDFDMAVFSDFNYESKYPHPGEEIEFTDISDGDVVLREWDFNDNGVIDSNQKNPSWTYYQEGEYKVTLKVWNSWGLSSTRIKYVGIKEIWPPKAICVPKNYPEEPGDNDLEIHFDARYSYDRDKGQITSYHWDFGDGTTAEDSHLYHTFPEPDKIYNVRLTVTDNEGGTESTTCVVHIDQTIPPVTEINHGYGNDGSDCYSSTQKISFSATDWTKVIDTFYRVDGGNWQRYIPDEQEYIPVGSEGQHIVEAYSVDFYGNQETPVEDIFIIDKTCPSLSVSIDGNEIDGWFINQVTVTMSGDDDLSGLDKIMYRYNSNNWVEYNGTFTIDDCKDYFIFNAMALDKAGNQVIEEKEIFIKNINPPAVPTISGPSITKPGETVIIKIISHDPGNEISYYIDWGDGDTEKWLGPYISGKEIESSHIYETKDSYIIKVKAKNQYDVESDWGTIEISMPKTYLSNPILQLLMKMSIHFPILGKILNINYN
jgi:PKD repeat protein